MVTPRFMLRYFLLFCFLSLLFWHATGQSNISIAHCYFQDKFNRTAAEWEPAMGTMITWPLCIPYKLAVELSKDNHLYTLVDNSSDQQQAESWFEKWGIPADKVTFIKAPQGIDAWWTRDWGPGAVFQPDGKMLLGDGKYVFATPETGLNCDEPLRFMYTDKNGDIIRTDTDDNATVPIGSALNIPVLDLPYVSTGGNFLTDGLGTAFSSCILLNENRFFGVVEDDFFTLNKSLAGITRYHILSNFEMLGIQHLDCFMKLLDEERILVAEPPRDHELWPIYENIVENELKNLKNVYGRPYIIKRIKIGRYQHDLLAAYTNSLILNKTIYVPLFQIAEDTEAIKTWQEAMPGYTVKGFTFSLQDEPLVSAKMKKHYPSGYGWTFGDALHCRARAVWNPDMLYMSVNRLPEKLTPDDSLNIQVTIIDYSKKGLVPGSAMLFWRKKGALTWNTQPLTKGQEENCFQAYIPDVSGKEGLEYYVAASSYSGQTETMPRTAPKGFYTAER